MRAKNRYISILLAICLVAGLLSMTVTIASNGSEDRTIMPGANGIAGSQKDSLYFGTYLQTSDGSGMGYNEDPIKWRALSNGDGELFLLADQILDMKPYYIKPDTIKWNDSEIPQTWEGSTLRQWMNGEFFTEAFNSNEQSAVVLTTNQNDDNTNYTNKENPLFNPNNPLYAEQDPEATVEGGADTEDYVFALSIDEAEQYFKADNIFDRILRPNQDRVAKNTAYAARGIDGVSKAGGADMYWLRSPGSLSSRAAVVNDNGDINEEGRGFVLQTVGVRPAFNMDLDSVLFTSAATGGKAVEGIEAIAAEYKGNEWKATILDESHKNFDATIVPSEEGQWTVSYTGAVTGENEYISVMIEDVNGAYTHYGRVQQLADESQASGTVTLDLTEIDMSDKTLHVFNEQYNGGANDDTKLTDYASPFVSISNSVYLPGFKNVTTSSFYDAAGNQMPDSVTADADGDSEEIICSYPTLKDMQGNVAENLDRMLLSLKVDFEEQEAYDSYTCLWVAGVQDYNGFRIRPQDSTKLRIETIGGVQTDGSPVFYLTSDRVGSMADEFILQLSFEYGDFDDDNNGTADDVRVGAYINGGLCASEMDIDTTNGYAQEDGHMVFYNCEMTKLGTGMRLYTFNRNTNYGAGDLTVSAFVPKNNELTQITWSDFRHNGEATKDQALVKGAFTDDLYSANLVSDICDKDGVAIDKLGNTSFEARLTLTNNGDYIYYGGLDGWRGIRFRVWDDGQLLLQTNDSYAPTLGFNNNECWFDPAVAGVGTFLNNEFSLKITTEYADYNGDGSEDVQFGVYFNDKLYNNQYCYANGYKTNGEQLLGNHIGILSSGNAILVRSASNTKAVVSNLANGNYTNIENDFIGASKVGDTNIELLGSTGLSLPGDYEVKDANDNVIGSLILYKTGEAHPDNGTDVKDLVAMLKVKNGMALSTWSGTTGACVPSFDMQAIVDTLLQ